MFKALLREPLLHFLVASLLLFVVFDNNDNADQANVIRISQAKISAMQAQWQQQWRRTPSQQELDGLINNAVNDELYYREGLRLGLDRDDAVVRNRLIQKMRFLQDQDVSDPTNGQLEDWLQEHKAVYPDDVFYSFQQIFIGNKIKQSEAKHLLATLNRGEIEPDSIAENLLVPSHIARASTKEVSRIFGESFNKELELIVINNSSTSSVDGEWVGPVRSGFGSHLIKLVSLDIVPMSLDNPANVQTLKNDWLNAQKKQLEKAYIQALLPRYDLEIEGQ